VVAWAKGSTFGKPGAPALQKALDTKHGGNSLLTEKADKQLKMTRKGTAFGYWVLGTGGSYAYVFLSFR
jgi:hypothetical protein